MPKYLLNVSYTTEGIQGVLKEGGSGRKAMVDNLVAGLGGTVEAFYFAFGDDDVIVIADLPDQTSAAAIAMRVGASGAAGVSTTVLLTARGDRQGCADLGRVPRSGRLSAFAARSGLSDLPAVYSGGRLRTEYGGEQASTRAVSVRGKRAEEPRMPR